MVLATVLGPAGPALGDWPTFRGDNARSGRAERAIGDSPAHLWKAELGGSVDGSPVVVGGRVFVGTNQGLFVGVVAESGELLWRAQLDGAICSAAAMAGDDRLLVGTSRRRLYCLSIQGTLLWQARAWDAVVASPLVVGGLCIWGSMDGVLHATLVADGTPVWERQLAGPVSAAPSGAEDVVYAADEAGVVWALRAGDGEVLWQRETRCLAMAAPVVADDVLLVPLVSPTQLAPPKVAYLVALDRATGEVKWQVTEARSVFASPLLGPQGVLYVSVEGYLSETFLRCQAADGGSEAWKQRLGGVVDSSPAMAGGRVYFGAQDGCLYVADSSSGAVLARVQLARKVFSSPALDGGRLYLGAEDGCLHCLQ